MTEISKYTKGILGTLIIHLCIVLIFLASRIRLLDVKHEKDIVVEFAKENKQNLDEKELSELTKFYKWYKNQSFSNVAVNNKELQEKISTEKYKEQLQNELKKQHDPIKIPNLDESIADDNQQENKETKTFTGKTNITWNLDKREKRLIPIPVYKCIGPGLVKVEIIVDQKGNVISTQVLENESSATECHYSEALKYAKMARFNYDFHAALHEKGWIQYNFIAQ